MNKTLGEWAYVDGHGLAFVPDRRLTRLRATDLLRPCRGYSASLAVENRDGRLIGWMLADDVGYPDVRTWMAAVRYLVQTERSA